jgi:hypothetical protein
MGSMVAAFKRLAPWLFFAALPLVTLTIGAIDIHGAHNLGNDFRYELYPEAKLVLQGTNPFPAPGTDLSGGQNLIFPVPAALLVAPLTLVAASTASILAALILLALLAATLWVLEVRDWRIYGLMGIWPGVIAAVQTGNLSIPLTLLVALAWRYRARTWAPGLFIGAAIAIKLFLWPLLVWVLALRRYRAAAIGASLGIAGGFLAVLPFTSIAVYWSVLDDLGRVFGPESYNPIGLLAQLHATSYHHAVLIADAVGVAVLALAAARRSLPLALASAFLLSPIVWTHYFVLLVVPLAIRWNRLSPAWLVPLAMWVCPGTGFEVRLRHVFIGLAVLATVTALGEWSPRRFEGRVQRVATRGG